MSPDRQQRLEFCLGVGVRMFRDTFREWVPSPVMSTYQRTLDGKQEVSPYEIEISISILEALMKKRDPGSYQSYKNIRESLLKENVYENPFGWVN